jgi:hypothetical protein
VIVYVIVFVEYVIQLYFFLQLEFFEGNQPVRERERESEMRYGNEQTTFESLYCFVD